MASAPPPGPPALFQVEVIISSAHDLKRIYWIHRRLNPYAVVWVDPNMKCFTKVDQEGDICPCWDETFVLPFSTPIEDSTLFFEIVHANTDSNSRAWIGSARVKLSKILNMVGVGEWLDRSLKLTRLSGRCKGILEVKIIVRQNSFRAPDPYYAPSAMVLPLQTQFSLMEVEEATRNFDLSMRIGRGGYGSVYRGSLRNTQVAIKRLHPNVSQGPLQFQQEVDVQSRMRHPNLVTLIGACIEACSLIYEYLSNGSLEDHLVLKENSGTLPWQRRISIIVDVCSALMFLHSNKPHSIIHGNVKPANILLDANMVSKLGDFGLCRLASKENNSIDTTTPGCITIPKDTFAYIDPEFLTTGQLTRESDVYSFGIVVLRLLTGKAALGIRNEVQCTLEKGNLRTILDATAGDWPFVQAKQLAHLALKCCEMNRRNRPDLNTEVWKLLKPMKSSFGSCPSFYMESQEHHSVPSYFLCPIFQEIMHDPHIAADGFTYEAEAIKAWLENGHDTSPMTNLRLDHYNLIPNHSLHSAIEEWLQKH